MIPLLHSSFLILISFFLASFCCRSIAKAAWGTYGVAWDTYDAAYDAYHKRLKELKEDLKIEDKKSKEWE